MQQKKSDLTDFDILNGCEITLLKNIIQSRRCFGFFAVVLSLLGHLGESNSHNIFRRESEVLNYFGCRRK